MKRSWSAAAAAIFALGVLAGCNDYNNSVQYNTGATLTNISPSGMPAGPAPSSAAQCQNSANGPTFPCFTMYVIASAYNPFVSTGTLPVVQWNGQKLPTTFIDTTNLSAQVPYSLLATPGTVAVNTYQPQSGTGNNGLSNALTFIIYGGPNPVPSLSSVSPTSAPYCDSTSAKCADVSITVTGTNFIPVSQNGGSQVTFTGLASYGQEKAITVTSISSTQMKATIPGTLLCASDNAQINVLNPPSALCLVNCPNLGGGDTNNTQPGAPQTFSITNATAVNTCPANVPPGTTAVQPAISQDGRYVAYASTQNGTSQILMRDTCLGAATDCMPSTKMVSQSPDGNAGNADSQTVTMTPDGRYVAFSSLASNLVQNAHPGWQVYVRDTCTGASGSCTASTRLVSVDAAGRLTGLAAVLPSISASGRYVAFIAETPSATTVTTNAASLNVMSSASSKLRQVFVRDTCAGVTDCIPASTRLATNSANALVAQETPSISADGRYVAYTVSQKGSWQVVVSDTCTGVAHGCTAAARTVSIAEDGSEGNAASHNPTMTPDGRYIAFSSAASNLIANAPLGRQVYVRDTCDGARDDCKASTMVVSADEQGQLTNSEAILPSISTTGRYVAFLAVNTVENAATAPNSGFRQVFVRDTCLGAPGCTPRSTRVSLEPSDVPPGMAPVGPALAGHGRQLAVAQDKTTTVFTASVPVDDRVVVAIPGASK